MPRIARRLLAGTAASALALGGVLVVAAPAVAADHVVTKTVDDGTDGTLRFEVENSAPGDTILFDPTVFATPQTIDLATASNAIEIPHDLTITGPGSDLLTLQRADANFALALFQVIPGGGQTDIDVTITGMTWDDTVGGVGGTPLGSAFVATSGADAGDLVFADLVVRDQGSEVGSGGGVLIEHADAVSFTDVEFHNNDAALDGGAIYVSDFASLTITRGVFTGNVSDAGGALYAFDGGPVTIADSEFAGESATAGEGGHAAIISVGDVAITGSSFRESGASLSGGAVFLAELGVLTIADSSFEDHQATSGGILYVEDLGNGDSTISGSSFRRGVATTGGAISASLGANETLTITTSVFEEDVADAAQSEAYGAALYFPIIDSGGEGESGAVVTVRDTTFTGQEGAGAGDSYGLSIAVGSLRWRLEVVDSTLDEHAGDGSDTAALYVASSSPESIARVAHSTISSTVGAIGGGTLDGAIEITHTILDDDGPLELVDRGSDAADGPITAEWSILSEAAPDVTLLAGNQVGVDPQLGPLQSNGGPTPTRLPATAGPAVNQGNPAVAGAPANDQRGAGFARIVQTIDIGAVEHQAELLPATGSAGSPWAALVALLVALAGAAVVVAARLRAAR